MQKLIALILAALMLVALCACGSSEDKLNEILLGLEAVSSSLEDLDNELTAAEHVESADSFRWNGMTHAWFLIPADVSPEMLLASSSIGSMCQTNGWTYERKELGPEDGTALSILNDAIADGHVGAVVYASVSDSLTEVVQTAADKGIIVLSLDPNTTAPIAGSIDIPHKQLGIETAKALEAWCEHVDYLPEDEMRLPVAVNLYGTGSTDTEFAAALLDTIAESEILYKRRVGLTPANAGGDLQSDAYLWARQVLNATPYLRLFCCDTPEAAYGICYYLEQYAAENELDLAEFCVVWLGEDKDSETYLTVALEDDSYTAARAYVTWGDDGWTTGSRLGYELLGIAYGLSLPTNLETTYVTLCENGVVRPEVFGGWLWGENALSGVTVYSTFAETEDRVFARQEMPLSDIINLNIHPDAELTEAEEGT